MKNLYLSVAVAAALSVTTGCQKSQDAPGSPSNKPLTINAIFPTHGAGGTTIKVSGTGFTSNPIYDTVKINGIPAVVDSATDSTLIVKIPVKAGSGIVSLNTGGKSAIGPVLKYDTVWVVTTYAGTTLGFADGTRNTAQFSKPRGVCVDKTGNIYVTDMGNLRIRKISASGDVSTLAGGTSGTADGIGEAAQFKSTSYVAVDASGRLYITDSYANRIKLYDPQTKAVTTIAGGTGNPGQMDGPRSMATLYQPNGIAVSDDGQYVYFCDMGNNNIRMISGEVVTTIAGNTCYTGHTDGPNRVAKFQTPYGLCLDAKQNVYISDTYSQAVRKLDVSTFMVSTIAGDTVHQGSKDGVGRAAQFFAPASICMDAEGNMYVADTQNHTIRQVTQAGVVTTIAGVAASPGLTDGIGTATRFNTPWGITIDPKGVLYVADTYNNKIRRLERQ